MSCCAVHLLVIFNSLLALMLILWLNQSSTAEGRGRHCAPATHIQLVYTEGELSSQPGESRPSPRSHSELHPAGCPRLHPHHQKEVDWVGPPRPARWVDHPWEEEEESEKNI